MAIIVEDGSIVTGANSYASVATADAYFEARNNVAWAALSDEAKESALIYAAAWLDSRYSWPGTITNQDQTLSWPREGATDSERRIIRLDEIPQVIIDAQCEAAAAGSVEALNEVLARGGGIDAVTVGDLSVTFSPRAPAGRTFPYIDAILSRLASPYTSGILTMLR